MNELTIYFPGSYLYFKTDEITITGAYNHFQRACESAGINFDNAHPVGFRLCDSEDNVIAQEGEC